MALLVKYIYQPQNGICILNYVYTTANLHPSYMTRTLENKTTNSIAFNNGHYEISLPQCAVIPVDLLQVNLWGWAQVRLTLV